LDAEKAEKLIKI